MPIRSRSTWSSNRRHSAAVAGAILVAVLLFALSAPGAHAGANVAGEWTDAELKTLKSLWIGALPPLPPDPSNRYADDPRAQKLGHRLFFDKRLGAGGWVSCATCHEVERAFTDGRTVAHGVRTASRNTMTLLGASYGAFFFWDGRKDSQWSQALGPMENPLEQAGTRTAFAHLIAEDPKYRAQYEAIFGPLPDISDYHDYPPAAAPVEDDISKISWQFMSTVARENINRIFANIGKAIAAYERLLVPGPSRFDRYVAALLKGQDSDLLTADEKAGLKLFIGPAHCTRCHNGPLFTNFGFHNTGIPVPVGEPPDWGHYRALHEAFDDQFNCTDRFSDAGVHDCAELKFSKIDAPELIGAFKVPTLRNVSKTGPYMHAGQFGTLDEVIDHYNAAPAALIGTTELKPLFFTPAQLDTIKAFLLTLDSPPATDPAMLAPPK